MFPKNSRYHRSNMRCGGEGAAGRRGGGPCGRVAQRAGYALCVRADGSEQNLIKLQEAIMLSASCRDPGRICEVSEQR